MDAPRLLEVMPTFNQEEKYRFLSISSLNFNEFIGYSVDKIMLMPLLDRSVLFKGRRVLEACHERVQKMDPNNPNYKKLYFKVTAKWGHIALLAQDWVAALSSYQEAYKCDPAEFWKEPGLYFGLGLCYLHFKDFKLAADAFQRVIYSFPLLDCIVEIKARLGLCHQNMSNYDQALKYYNQAMSEKNESAMLPRIHIRFNIALTKENSGDLNKAEEEYKQILDDLTNHVRAHQNMQYTPEQIKLLAALNRQLGWVSYRHNCDTQEERSRRLGDAESYLGHARQVEPLNGRTYYFFGRCYGELPTKAHDAFINYRHSIDKSEADADTWCSIGWLYQQQNQPIDALQAFVCAVELDAEHSAAWTDLGQLYEIHHQFEDALNCYKQAVKFNPVAPEALKARISVLEKELNSSTQFLAQRNTPQPQRKLTSLKDAWHLPIPSELRQRQDEFLKVKQQRYRDGSPLWRMGELAAPIPGNISMSIQEKPGLPPMDSQQIQMMRLLQVNRERLNDNERQLLRELEQRDRECQEASYDSFYPIHTHIVSSLPTFTDQDFEAIKAGDHIKTEIKIEMEEEGNEADSAHHDIHFNNHLKAIQDKHITSNIDLPTTFSLDAKLHVPLDISSNELLDLCAKRVERPAEFKPIFEERMPPPRPPSPPSKEDIKPVVGGANPLLKPTPLVVVESRKDAQSAELQRFVENTPIALIRGLTAVLKMDLSLFSTKTLREVAAETEVEVRTQYKMPCDLNVDHLGVPSWECHSSRSFTTVHKYSLYQAETFQHSLKEEAEKLRTAGAKYAQQVAESNTKRRRGPNGEEWAMPMKMIKFGTNVDLSDEQKWKPQLQELSKMPPFCRLIAGCNMLSHLGHTVLGMNTVQLYMKVPGSRTPAHQENNSFASININVGPGDCEWFGVPNEYWGAINTMCKKRGIDFLKGSYWPNVEDLLDEGIPVYRFTQKAGDLVWVGGGCVHWVQATGWCNNIAWNVGPMTYQQLTLSVSSYEWNKLQGYKSLVPLQHLCWQLAKNIRFTNQKIFTLVRSVLIRSLAFCKMVSDWAQTQTGKPLKNQPRQKGEITHYCTLCEVEVFNILFVKELNGKFPVYCVYCARRAGLNEFIVLQQIPMPELKKIFDEVQMNHIPKASLVC